MILYCQSLDLILVWQLLLFISRFLFGNIKIAPSLTTVVVDHPMHAMNYSQAQTLKSLFVDLFTMSYSQRHLMRIMKFMCRSFPLWWSYYFLPALCQCLVLTSWLRDLKRVFIITCLVYLFLSWHSSFDNSAWFLLYRANMKMYLKRLSAPSFRRSKQKIKVQFSQHTCLLSLSIL